VTSVDLAAPAIADVAANFARSGLDPAAHEHAVADAFDFLARAQQRGRTWDLVIADPPSFAPSEKARSSALGAYRRLARAALAVTAPGGRLAFASCSSHVTEADLLELFATAEAGARALQLRLVAGAASDHPVLAAFPEGRYLKFLLFDVA
jgi:23S rRNA (cytosine1962-C5)-methyltransferase